jgi:hypothetical protein
MVAEPSAIPTTTPDVVTVATPVFELLHVTARDVNAAPVASLAVAVI